jgi:hypothetical protein
MHEILCPHCHKAFTIDEAGYADIARQVRDREFDRQLQSSLALVEQDKRTALEAAQLRMQADLQELAATKDAALQEVRAQLATMELEKTLAVNTAVVHPTSGMSSTADASLLRPLA